MGSEISQRLFEIVEALPLKRDMRVLEIGCGPGAMAREMAKRVGAGKVVAIDRSAKAIAQAIAGSDEDIAAGRLEFRQSDAETFALEDGEPPFDIAVAVRVGALDGRHEEAGVKARSAIAKALRPGGRLFIDGGTPIREIGL